MGQEDEMMMRKGPWTEQEDVQLISFVNMFGDRRWDFIAKVSGLKRSGKSCRLRWVNYLHPGLKRGKMTPQEERRILELHSKWGNRWSRIARKLPGRTDNEIKNYWRTHMRKKAQEMKRALPPSPSATSNSSNSYSSICTSNPTTFDSVPFTETNERSFYDTGGLEEMVAFTKSKSNDNNTVLMKSSSATSVNSFISEEEEDHLMDDVWKDLLEDEEEDIRSCVFGNYDYSEEIAAAAPSASPIWDYSLWMINDGQSEEIIGSNVFFPNNKRLMH